MRTLLLLCVMLLGCESVPDVIAKHRSGVEKTFTAITALTPKVAAVEPGSVAKVKAAPVVLEGNGGTESNAMFIYAEDLPKPGDARPVPLRTLDTAPLLQCGSLLTRQLYVGDSVTKPSPSVTEQYLSACERLKYVLVIRKLEFTEPELSLETRQFKSGKYRAEILAYELQSGELLGGFPISAKNEDSVMLLDGDASHVKRLITNLESTTFSAIRDGARQAFPGSLPAPPPK